MSHASIREFTRADIEFATAQTDREGWHSTAASFEMCLRHDPDGCFIAEVAGTRAGMVSTTQYVEAAWIGRLIVSPEFRRRGVGRDLMIRAMQHLARFGVRTIRLEADPPGVNLYRSLGFVDEFESLRFCGRADRGPADAAVDTMTEDDLDEVAAFDAEHFGDDRSRLLRLLLPQAIAARSLRSGGSVRGYALLMPSRKGARIGPWVAVDESTARTLLQAVLAGPIKGTVSVGFPGVNQSAVAMLESFGFLASASCCRMVHGPRWAVGLPERVYGIASGAMG